jgi:hypothetical protein
MMAFHFVDSRGISWMVIPSLPANHPDASDGNDTVSVPPTGFTFRASTGELRVLPRAEIRRVSALAINVAPLKVGPRLHQVTDADWEALLNQARRWP